MSTTIAVKKEVTSRTIRLHPSSREIFDRLLIGEHTVMLKQIVLLKQIVHHIRCRGRRWRCSLAICEVITLLIFA